MIIFAIMTTDYMYMMNIITGVTTTSAAVETSQTKVIQIIGKEICQKMTQKNAGLDIMKKIGFNKKQKLSQSKHLKK